MTRSPYQTKLSLSVALIVALACPSSFAAQPKHVAVAPEQMAHQQLKSPTETGVYSHSTMLPVDFSNPTQKMAADGSLLEQISHSIYFDNSQNTPMLFLGPTASSWKITVTNPMGTEILNENLPGAQQLATQSIQLGEQTFSGKQLNMADAASGEYQITISRTANMNTRAASSNGASPTGYLMFKGDPTYKVYSHFNQNMTIHRQPLQMVAFAVEDPATNFERQSLLAQPALKSSVTSAQATITSPSNQRITLSLNDNGINGDRMAGDGKFSATMPSDEIGVYTSQLQIQGIRPDGMKFSRTVTELYPIEPQTYKLGSAAAHIKLDQGHKATLSVPVSRTAAIEDVYLSAELWGTNQAGEKVPAAWIGGVVAPENQQPKTRLNIGFDTRWLTRQNLRAPFGLKSVRLQTLDTNVPIALRDKLKIAINQPSVDEIYRRASVGQNDRQSVQNFADISNDMLMGSAPLQTEATIKATSNPKLLLVHGYCSSGNTWQTSSFSNSAQFQDLNQNRSHEEFAQRLISFGAPYTSYGIVAHSQGGAAALHLYSRYWSGLDYATDGRIIQSVGTPYQGTALAGNLAVLGSVFGAGCGTNTDLTYSGASNWLATIPSWARSEVDYYTTSFNTKWWRYDYCHLATDLFLNDPEDGTTEKWSGQLSGAVNKGHKKGWCHTSGMRDPAQTTDSNRNASMNSRAAR